MKLRDLYLKLNSTELVRVYDMDPDEAKPGDALFDGFAVAMRVELGELFDRRVLLISGGYVDCDIVIQIEEVEC